MCIFYVASKSCYAIAENIGQIYLINDLKFSKDDLNMISILTMPINVLFSFLLGHFGKSTPFKLYYLSTLLYMATTIYVIFVLFLFFPEEITNYTIMHVIVVVIAQDVINTLQFSANMTIVFNICDTRMPGMYITLLTSLNNMGSIIHKTYVFLLVEYFGIYGP